MPAPLAALFSLAALLPLTGDAQAGAKLNELSVDELIGMLPDVGHEWTRAGKRRALRPAVAEMARRLNEGAELTDEQWLQALLESGALRYRSVWPAEQPFAVSMRKPAWLDMATIRMEPTRKGLRAAELSRSTLSWCGTESFSASQGALYQELGRLPVGRHVLDFDVVVERWAAEEVDFSHCSDGLPKSLGVLWKGRWSLPCEVVESVDQAVPPASGPALDAALRSGLSLARRPKTTQVGLHVAPDLGQGSPFAGVGFAIRVELLNAGQVVEEALIVPSAEAYDYLLQAGSGEPRSGLSCILTRVPALASAAGGRREHLKNWSLRLTGTPERVVGLWDIDSRWEGQVIVPLAELLRRR